MTEYMTCKLCGAEGVAPEFVLDPDRLHVCPACDFHYLDRLDPTEDDRGRELDDDGRRFISTRLPADRRLQAVRLGLVAEHVDLSAGNLLDIGAGVGQFLSLLKEAGGAGSGIEPSGLRRQFAREQFGLDLHPQPVEDSSWSELQFDAVTLWDVLEHVNDPVVTLERAFRLLRPGGRLFIETLSRDTLGYRLSCRLYRLTGGKVSLLLPSFYEPVPYGHKQLFRPDQLYALLEQIGFRMVAATPRIPGLAKTSYRPAGRIIVAAQKPDQ